MASDFKDFAAWSRLPASKRPPLARFRLENASERQSPYRLDVSSKSPDVKASGRESLRRQRSSALRRQASGPTGITSRTVPSPRQPLRTPVSLNLGDNDMVRLRREYAVADRQSRVEAKRSEGGFRKWLKNFIGATAAMVATGALRTVWTVVTGMPPFF